MKRFSIFKLHNFTSNKKMYSNWVIFLNDVKEENRHEKKNCKAVVKEKIEFFLFKNLKETGNHLFKQNNYRCARDLYSISLTLVPVEKILERSLGFSNRAQSLIFLELKNQSITECIGALKLQPKHDKSWYRKIFVSKRFKDYLSCLKIILIVYSLSVKFTRNHSCTQSEIYCKNIIRLGNVSLKKKRVKRYLNWKKEFSEMKINSILKPRQEIFIGILEFIGLTTNTLMFIIFIYNYNILNYLIFAKSNYKSNRKIEFFFYFKAKLINIPDWFLKFRCLYRSFIENSVFYKPFSLIKCKFLSSKI